MKVRKGEAEEVRKKLVEMGVLDRDRKATKRGDFVYFPVTQPVEGYEVVDVDLPPTKKKPRDIVEALKDVLTPEELERLVKSFDIIGHVAVIEIPEELRKREADIARAILAVHPNVKTVAVEEGPHTGEFRVQPVRVIAGDPNLVTVYREHGVRMMLEVGKTYFSVRHSYERKRIAEQVKPGEVVAALFAGVGPYPLVIARKQPGVKKIYAVELNPVAWKYLVKNVEMNGFQDKIIPVRGDVRDVVPRMFPGMADRVLMPLPKTSHEFLDIAMIALKPEGGIVHYYTFGPAEDPYSEAERKIREVAEEFGYNVEVLTRRKVADYAPYVWKVVLDIKLSRVAP